MLGKLADIQRKTEEIKSRLSAITVEGEAASGDVKVIMDANKKIKDIFIAEGLLFPEKKEELQDYLVIAFEKALGNAETVSATEMKQLMSNMMPGLGGLFGK
jgi:DNA-binding YbaB/EbfC family protein